MVPENVLLVIPRMRSPYDSVIPNASAVAVSSALATDPIILDLNATPDDALVTAATQSDVRFAFFTCMVDSYGAAIEGARKLRDVAPQIRTAVGGAHVTLIASAGGEIDPSFDAVAVGEAEAVMSRLLNELRLERGAQKVIAGPGRRPLLSVNEWASVKPRWGAVLQPHHLPLLMIEGSRGCPFHCQFCSHSDLAGDVLRTKSAGHLVCELSAAQQECGVHHFRFTDSDLTSPARRFAEICKDLRDYRAANDVEWVAFARMGDLDPNALALARAAGCIGMFVGIESPKDSTLRQLRKAFNRTAARASIRAARDLGVLLFANYMFGLPGDKAEDWELIVEDVLDLGFQSVNVNQFFLAPKSRYAEDAVDYGVQVTDHRWLDHFHEIFEEGLEYFRTREMTQPEMQEGVRKIRSSLMENKVLWNLRDYHLLAWRSVGGNSDQLYRIWNKPEDVLEGDALYAVQEMRGRGVCKDRFDSPAQFKSGLVRAVGSSFIL